MPAGSSHSLDNPQLTHTFVLFQIHNFIFSGKAIITLLGKKDVLDRVGTAKHWEKRAGNKGRLWKD